MRIGISTDVTLAAGAGRLSCEIVYSPRTRGSGTYWRGRPMPAEPPGSGDPLDPAGLVGRAAEAAAIRRMLDGAALVTVTGLPGVGKTAVSLAAVRAAAAGFADGSLLLRLDTPRVPGEATVEVRPLRLADAVEPFSRRAVQAGVEISPHNRAAVASVCVQLDKLPLAIELAAAELARLRSEERRVG